jgi:hypothetical protein
VDNPKTYNTGSEFDSNYLLRSLSISSSNS